MSITKAQGDNSTPLLAGEERRRSQRVIIRIPVTLEVLTPGKQATLSARTVAVNIHGAMVLCSRPLEMDTRLEIVSDKTQQRASARVTRAPRASAEGYLIPLEFSVALPEFWQIIFPPSTWKPADS